MLSIAITCTNIFLIELKAFVRYVTGSTATVGKITVSFSEDTISASTCGRQLVLSTAVDHEDIFISAMKVVICDKSSFTML